MRPFLSYRASKVWLIISALLIVLAIVVTCCSPACSAA